LLTAAFESAYDPTAFRPDPVFRVLVPERCAGVPTALLHPRETWSDPAAYDAQARLLAARFAENFAQYEPYVPREVAAAGPRVDGGATP
jgi:phosphoenolpyruvate carboxykinase (ATP)